LSISARRLAQLEARLSGASVTDPNLGYEKPLRLAFEVLPDEDMKRIRAFLDRNPDDGSDRVPVELATDEEAKALHMLGGLVDIFVQ
jgi:hypothetical protein